MIRHFELVHAIRRGGAQPPGTESPDLRVLRDLRDAVQRLSRKCVQLMPAA